MSLTNTIAGGIDAAFEALGDLVGQFTVSSTTEVFNDDTNTYSESIASTDFDGFYGEFENKFNRDVNVLSGDVRIFLRGDTSKAEPKKGDAIYEKGSSVKYTIVESMPIKTYQTTFMYDIQARE